MQKVLSPNLVNCLVHIENLKKYFTGVSFQHVYRELNNMAYGMSKKGLDATLGFLHYNFRYDGRV